MGNMTGWYCNCKDSLVLIGQGAICAGKRQTDFGCRSFSSYSIVFMTALRCCARLSCAVLSHSGVSMSAALSCSDVLWASSTLVCHG